ncbi:hypothetical protein DYU11_15320 [Fibrisoma montanum]|uniref:Capsule assembly Wzi family protein n=1 Tax=Fibrisoma montanum TaxID=2305895 RepID=A0A418M8G2_9BACT|nr:capsule assembly Wzi family protein [Fibrisoma montanum]RIV22386.1 hypothetical protein DYU11_15320 [Fibrisoma montanum]
MSSLIFRLQCSLAVLLVTTTAVFGQKLIEYHAEAGGMSASDQTPFWLRANQYGTVPLRTPFFRLNAGIRSDYVQRDSTGFRPKLDWGYGVDVIANAGSNYNSQFLLPEAYVKGRFGAFEIYGGRRREIVGLVDTLLTTGGYAWSGNALPFPKIQIGIPVFTPIPFTKGIVSVMGAYAHGWFENSGRLVKGSYLHQKYFYGRLGKPTWPFRFYAGFNHQVMWGGESSFISPNASLNGQLPTSLKNYWMLVFGIRGNPGDKTISSFEWNRIGNHLGSIDVGVDANLGAWNVMLYRQSLYDDGSLFYWINIADGLNGLRIKNRRNPDETAFFLRQITFEYLYTANQGGDKFVIEDELQRGKDDYFNHSQFLDGWTYFGRTVGTPFLTPDTETSRSLPRHGAGIANNRVSVGHFAASALVLNKLDITARLSFGTNYGTYNVPFPTSPRQFSGMLTASLPVNLLGGMVVNGSVALDSGELLPNSAGFYLGLRKTGFFGTPNRPTPNRSRPAPAPTTPTYRWP